MIAIEFASNDDACLVLKALPAEVQADVYFRSAIEAVLAADDIPAQQAEPARLFVPAELEEAGRSLAADLPAARKAALRLYAERRRWEIEVGGIMVDGLPIRTDDVSQRKILGAYVAATRNPSWSTLWESIRPIDAEKMIEIGDAVQAHVNASFVTRGAVFDAIEAGTIATTSAIDAAEWPSNG